MDLNFAKFIKKYTDKDKSLRTILTGEIPKNWTEVLERNDV
jgi:hypothetical protein